MLTALVVLVGYVVVSILIEVVLAVIPERIKSATGKLVMKAMLAFQVLFPVVAICVFIGWREWVWAMIAALFALWSVRLWRKERECEEQWERTKIEMEALGIPTKNLD